MSVVSSQLRPKHLSLTQCPLLMREAGQVDERVFEQTKAFPADAGVSEEYPVIDGMANPLAGEQPALTQLLILCNPSSHRSHLIHLLEKMGVSRYQITIQGGMLVTSEMLAQHRPGILFIDGGDAMCYTEEMIRTWKKQGVEKVVFLIDSSRIPQCKKQQLLWMAQKLGVHILFGPINPFMLVTLVKIPHRRYYNSKPNQL